MEDRCVVIFVVAFVICLSLCLAACFCIPLALNDWVMRELWEGEAYPFVVTLAATGAGMAIPLVVLCWIRRILAKKVAQDGGAEA